MTLILQCRNIFLKVFLVNGFVLYPRNAMYFDTFIIHGCLFIQRCDDLFELKDLESVL